MPDKPVEMSLESRLIASLRMQRRAPIKRSPISKSNAFDGLGRKKSPTWWSGDVSPNFTGDRSGLETGPRHLPQNADSRALRARGAILSAADILRAKKPSPKRPRGPKPLRFGKVPQNPAFLAFARTLPCILWGATANWGTQSGREHVCSGIIEAAHTGRHGMRHKAADETAVPMCSNAHRTGKFSHHNATRSFWDIWGINQKEVVEKIQQAAKDAGIYVAEGVL